MKKLIVLILALSFMFALTACKNKAQEQLVVYSFYGENECFAISNGTIVLSNSEDIFYGVVYISLNLSLSLIYHHTEQHFTP